MTPLDEFAKAAMQGMTARGVDSIMTAEGVAKCAFNIAEAMLAESKKRQPPEKPVESPCIHGAGPECLRCRAIREIAYAP